MTTFEHAMLGINGALASGLHRRHGWKIVALAGFAAIAPDWDGLPMLIDMAAFERGHRVWGHNVLACFLLALVLGSLEYRFDLVGRVSKRMVRFGPFRELAPYADARSSWQSKSWMLWIAVAFIAALSQIPADAVVSGGKGLSVWELKPLWPFSHKGFVYPMVPWGNVGATLIFSVGMLAFVRWKGQLQNIALATLVSVAAYIVIWGVWIR